MADSLPVAPALSSLLQRAAAAAEIAAMAARMARDLPGFLRTPLTPEAARANVVHRVENREARLLDLVERAVYAHPDSPYARLLRHAGCTLEDLRALVRREGVEGALRVLASHGVYVRYDEMKGRRELVRGSLRLRLRASDLDNPLLRPHYLMYSGGSGGRPSRVRFSLAGVEERASSLRMVLAAHGATEPGVILWWPAPLCQVMMLDLLRLPVVGWYYPIHPPARQAHLAAWYVAALGRVAGRRLPRPRRWDLARTREMARHVAAQLRERGSVVLWTMASAGARVAVAAAAEGLDLRGAIFLLSGEPVTDARRRQIEATGARVLVQYSAVEASTLALTCADAAASDDVHVMVDRYAAITRRRTVAPAGPEVDAVLVTTLTPTHGKILFNTELGDDAHLEERACGCLLGGLGMRVHLSGIRSFEKLTGEAVTFVRSNLEQVVEQQLPACFGGTSVDYQLSEEEVADGVTRLVLRVHPDVGAVDCQAVSRYLLAAISRAGPVERYHARMWRESGILDVRREAPTPTGAGKVLPLRIVPRP